MRFLQTLASAVALLGLTASSADAGEPTGPTLTCGDVTQSGGLNFYSVTLAAGETMDRVTVSTKAPTSGMMVDIPMTVSSQFYSANGMSAADSGVSMGSQPITFSASTAETSMTFYAYNYICMNAPGRLHAPSCLPMNAVQVDEVTCGGEVAPVGPVCGDDTVEGDEECDGSKEGIICSDECEILSTTTFECGQGTADSVTVLVTPGLVGTLDVTAVTTTDYKTVMDFFVAGNTKGSTSQNGVQKTFTVSLEEGETEKTVYIFDIQELQDPSADFVKVGEITCEALSAVCGNGVVEGDELCDGENGCTDCIPDSTTTLTCSDATASSVSVTLTAGFPSYFTGSAIAGGSFNLEDLVNADSVPTTADPNWAADNSGNPAESSPSNGGKLSWTVNVPMMLWNSVTFFAFDFHCVDGTCDKLHVVDEITCNVPQCGNGSVEGDEECDDENLSSGDGCSAMCTKEPPSETTIQCGESTGTSVSVIITSSPGQVSSNTHSVVSTVDDATINNILRHKRLPGLLTIDTAFDNDIWSAAVTAGSSLTWTIETTEAVEFFAYDVIQTLGVIVTQVPDMSVICEPSVPGVLTWSVSGQLDKVNVALSKTTFAEVTITNVGTGSLPLSEETKVLLELSGADAASFTIATQPDVAELEAGASTSFMVMFSPTTVGKHTATIEILDNTVTIEGTGIYEAISVVSANNIVLPKAEGKYDAGVVSEDAIAVDFSIKSIGGLAVNVVSVSATGSAQISNDISGTAVAFGESASVLVTLPVTVGETATSVVTIETDSIEMPTRTITISATGAQDSLMFSSASAGVAFSGKTIEAPVAIAGLTTSAVSVKATNPTSEAVTIASIALADQAVDGLTLTNGEALIGQTIAAGESVQLDFAFAPTTSSGTASTSVEIGLEDKRSVFTFMVGTTTADLAWAADVEGAYALKEGETLSLDFSLPTAPSTDVAPVAFLASGTTMSLVDFELTTTFNGLVGTVDVAIMDDDIEEAAETLTLTLATSGRTVTITVAGNDEPEANTELPEEEDVVIEVAGNKPATAQDDGEEKGSVSVKINKSSTSNGGTVRVVIVEESDEVADYEDPNFEVADSTTTGSSWKTAGVSFAVELSEGVLVDTIEIDAKYSCTANEDELDLFLFDKEVNEWRSAGDYCTAEQYKAPQFDNGKACVATFTVCHLTQFAVVQRQVSGVEDTPTTPTTPNAPSSTVDETASGAGAADDDDGLAAGWIGVIVTAVGIVLIVGIVLVVVRKKKTGEKTAAGLGGEDSFSSDTESGLSNAGGFSSSASTSASSSASASASTSASASSSSALSSGSSGSSSSGDASSSASSSSSEESV